MKLMKKLYFLILCLAGAGVSNAQTFSYTPSNNVHTELAWDTFTTIDMSFSTQPVGAIQYQWELISNDMPQGWSYSLCDYTGCYSGIPSNGTMTAINSTEASNGTEGFFKINLHPGTIAAFATVQIYVHDINDYNEGDTVTFTMNLEDQLSTGENELSNISIYPNPAEDMLTISNISQEGNIELYNIAGAVVSRTATSGSTKEIIDVSALEPGVYFISFVTLEGIRNTQKVTIK